MEVLKKHKKYFEIIALSANTKAKLLKKQAQQFGVKTTALGTKTGTITKISSQTLIKLATTKEADIIVNVLSGISGIAPTIAALKAGKILLLGNKESLFVEGKKIMRLAAHSLSPDSNSISRTADHPRLIPLDSEHNAIFEILHKVYENATRKKLPPPKIKKIILPCSGGPFYGQSAAALAQVTPAQACKHPRYKMGRKISIESATLINKGLEIIEAHHLFGLPLEKIATVFHPKCEIHGAIEFNKVAENSKTHSFTLAYVSSPDMREHIENALLRAANLPIPKRKIIELAASAKHSLQPLLPVLLPGISLIMKIFKKHHQSPRILKNFLLREENAIRKFLAGKIKFMDIFKL